MPGLSSLFISFNMNMQIVEILRKVDCKFYDKDTQEWEVPITYLAQLIDQFYVIDDIDLVLLEDKKSKFISYPLKKFKTNPYPYQRDGIEFGLNNAKWLLLDVMGLGKSLQAIYLAEELHERSKVKHCLIICGVNSLKFNWKREIQKHSKLSCVILGEKKHKKNNSTIIGSIKDRVDHLKKEIPEFFIITNVQTLRDDKIIKALKSGPNNIDMIVVDEIHTCKSTSSQQGKNLLKLKNFKYKLGMTGTLLLNHPIDLYLPLRWIGVEHSSPSVFKACYYNYGGRFHNIFLGYRNLDILKYQLEKYSLRRTKELLDLPPKTFQAEILEMEDTQQQFYDNIKSGIVSDVDKVEINTVSILSMIARLRQATACPSILTSENIPSAKIDRAVALSESIISNGDKVIIFSTFKQTVKELSKKLQQFNPVIITGDTKDSDLPRLQEKFQSDPSAKIFIGTWQKCGTGLTLTAASYMIFIDTPWTDAVFQQACDRIHRIGTKNPVFIYNLICKGTVDEKVFEILQNKKALSEYIIDDNLSASNISILKDYIQELAENKKS